MPFVPDQSRRVQLARRFVCICMCRVARRRSLADVSSAASRACARIAYVSLVPLAGLSRFEAAAVAAEYQTILHVRPAIARVSDPTAPCVCLPA